MTCPQPPGSKGNTGSGQTRPQLGGLVRLESVRRQSLTSPCTDSHPCACLELPLPHHSPGALASSRLRDHHLPLPQGLDRCRSWAGNIPVPLSLPSRLVKLPAFP